MLCVVITMAVPVAVMSFSSCSIELAVSGSRLPVGSSAMITFGWLSNARAIDMRCC